MTETPNVNPELVRSVEEMLQSATNIVVVEDFKEMDSISRDFVDYTRALKALEPGATRNDYALATYEGDGSVPDMKRWLDSLDPTINWTIEASSDIEGFMCIEAYSMIQRPYTEYEIEGAKRDVERLAPKFKEGAVIVWRKPATTTPST